MQKLLTIVVPVYNTEKYLPKCLDSLIVPEYLDQLEVLVIIDGSPDNSAAVAKQYQQQYPSTFIVIEKENGGHGSTINKGLSLATGKYFRVLDSDDWFDEANFKLFLDRLSTADEDIVMTHVVREYTSEGKSLLWKDPDFDEMYEVIHKDCGVFSKLDHAFFTMARCTYKTQLLSKHHLTLLERQSFEDTFLHIFPIPYVSSFIFYDLPLYHYYLERPGQSVGQHFTIKHWQDWCNLVKQMIAFYNVQKPLLPTRHDYILKIIKSYANNLYVMATVLPYQEGKQVLYSLHKHLKTKDIYKDILGLKMRCYTILPYWCYKYGYIWYTKLRSKF
ncbi:MAG: glycosyltransferase family 2 protein [Bacteroidales bacterium]|nr:glycosyltransferase family 2 protein [Bacteroidales bacterium]